MNTFILLFVIQWALRAGAHGQQLHCASFLEAVHMSNIHLGVNRTLCLQKENTTSIYAITVTKHINVYPISSRHEVVLNDFQTETCHCSCEGEQTSPCSALRNTRGECLHCIAETSRLVDTSECGWRPAQACCLFKVVPVQNVSVLVLSSPSSYLSIQLSIWNEGPDGHRTMKTNSTVRLSAGRRHRISMDELQLEINSSNEPSDALSSHSIIDVESSRLISFTSHHRCLDAVVWSEGGPLISDHTCLPSIKVDHCTKQKMTITKRQNAHLDFSVGRRVDVEESLREIVLEEKSGCLVSINDVQNRFRPLEDSSRLHSFANARIVLDKHSHRKFHADLIGARGRLHFAVNSIHLHHSHSAQFSVPSTAPSPYSISINLPPWINTESTVCVHPLGDLKKQTCTMAPFIIEEVKERSFFDSSPVWGCVDCSKSTVSSVFHGWISTAVPVDALGRLLSGSSLAWSDLQILFLALIHLILLIGVLYIIRKYVWPLFECCLCCLMTSSQNANQYMTSRRKLSDMSPSRKGLLSSSGPTAV